MEMEAAVRPVCASSASSCSHSVVLPQPCGGVGGRWRGDVLAGGRMRRRQRQAAVQTGRDLAWIGWLPVRFGQPHGLPAAPKCPAPAAARRCRRRLPPGAAAAGARTRRRRAGSTGRCAACSRGEGWGQEREVRGKPAERFSGSAPPVGMPRQLDPRSGLEPSGGKCSAQLIAQTQLWQHAEAWSGCWPARTSAGTCPACPAAAAPTAATARAGRWAGSPGCAPPAPQAPPSAPARPPLVLQRCRSWAAGARHG